MSGGSFYFPFHHLINEGESEPTGGRGEEGRGTYREISSNKDVGGEWIKKEEEEEMKYLNILLIWIGRSHEGKNEIIPEFALLYVRNVGV